MIFEMLSISYTIPSIPFFVDIKVMHFHIAFRNKVTAEFLGFREISDDIKKTLI